MYNGYYPDVYWPTNYFDPNYWPHYGSGEVPSSLRKIVVFGSWSLTRALEGKFSNAFIVKGLWSLSRTLEGQFDNTMTSKGSWPSDKPEGEV